MSVRTWLLGVVVGVATASGALAADGKPNILVIWGDDIGQFNVSAYNRGMMGYRTPNIDRIAQEGALFTDWYGQQSCTAGRAAFVTGQSPIRTGLTKVGLPGAPEGMQKEDPTIATLLRAQGYMTGQFGKNHLGDRDEVLPTAHGFVSLREAIDTGSPLGQAVFTIIAAIAQLERSLIAERVLAGLRRAKAEGKRLGRPRVQVDPARLASAVRRGLSVRDGARELRVSASSYARLARQCVRLGGVEVGRLPNTLSPSS